MNNALFLFAAMTTFSIVWLQIKVSTLEDKVKKLESKP
jgi:hypothetical protein